MGRASAAQGGEYDQEHQARDTQQAADTMVTEFMISSPTV